MTKEFNVTALVKLFERGQIKAFIDVTIAFCGLELKILGFRIVQEEGQEPWVALPTSSYQKGDKMINKTLKRWLRLVGQFRAFLKWRLAGC